jgi:hypothetical protein
MDIVGRGNLTTESTEITEKARENREWKIEDGG